MPDAKRRIVAFLIAIGVFGIDRWTKWLVETQLNVYDTRTVIPGFFDIVRAGNTGVAFSMFADAPAQWRLPLLIGVSVVATALLAGMLWRIERLDGASAFGLALIFGGAIGNMFDRVRAGRVTDFLDFYTGAHHWYTFNVADTAIWTGAGLLVMSMLRSQRKPHEVRGHA